MPEYLAPGVYVEETSFRPNSIEGVSTSTAAFVGPTRFGPLEGEPEVLTSFADFERIYGGLDMLEFDDSGTSVTVDNYLAHGVRAFFEEGGQRCYVARAFLATDEPTDGLVEGTATATIPDDLGPIDTDNDLYANLIARYPGAAGNLRVSVTPSLGRNILGMTTGSSPEPMLQGARDRDTVVVITTEEQSPPLSVSEGFYNVSETTGGDIELVDTSGSTTALSDLSVEFQEVRKLTATIEMERPLNRPQQPGAQYGPVEVLEGFTFDPDDRQSLVTYFHEEAPSRRVALYVPFYIDFENVGEATGAEIAELLFDATGGDVTGSDALLEDGADGSQPQGAEYRGEAGREKSGLRAIEDLNDVSIVAAPGYTDRVADDAETEVLDIQSALIAHCETMQYRIAVLDTPANFTISEAREYRGSISSTHAALYYPWVTVFDPIRRAELNLPPSGFITGIYARNDTNRGVQKAPANETIRLAIGLETRVNKAQQDVLNPESVNCLRFFEGRGYRVWGARLTTDDVEYKYVNIRRYLAFLQRSIDEGTQTFVFESNGPALWDNVRRTIDNFLRNEWQSGRLLGTTEAQAYFVRCDLSTMTQNDLDNGRLICEIGVSLLRPAEFVIFRIGQKLLEANG